jgi:DNA polymerase III subunit delta'
MATETLRTRGHATAVASVDRWIRDEHAPHAVLISGPDGCGKTTLALDLAAGLLCLAADTAERPCRSCAACHKIAHGNHPDVHRIAPQGAGEQIRLVQVQQLIADLALLPMEGRVRFCLIEDAQRLNPDAQNALLKALEEPVGASCLVLAADDTAPLLPTVISRVARLRLGPVAVETITAWLSGLGVPVADARRAAAAADGRPGWALALVRDPEIGLARDRLARQLLDLASADRRGRLAAATDLIATGLSLDAASAAAAAPDTQSATETDSADVDAATSPPQTGARARSAGARTRRAAAPPPRASASRPQPADRRRAVVRVLDSWREVGRDLAVDAAGGRAHVRRPELLEEIEALAPRVDRIELVGFLDSVDALSAAVESYASPELVLDALLLRWPRAMPISPKGTARS